MVLPRISSAKNKCVELLNNSAPSVSVYANESFVSNIKTKKLFSKWLKDSLKIEDIKKIKSTQFKEVNNEAHGYKLLTNLKQRGAHIGVGGDFNYTVAGYNRSSQVIIYDVNPNVMLFHQILRSLILFNDSPLELITTLKKISEQTLEKDKTEIFYSEIPNDKIIREKLPEFITQSNLISYLTEISERTDSEGHRYTYLGDESSYQHIQSLFKTDQIRFGISNQFEKGFFESLVSQFKFEKISTFYISNTLDYVWLIKANEKHLSQIRKYVNGFSSLMLGGVKPTNLLEFLHRAETDTAMRNKNKESDTFELGLSLLYADIKDAAKPWRQFWDSAKKLPLDPEAKILSTNREAALFGVVFDKYSTEVSDEVNLKWRYAQLIKEDWDSKEFYKGPERYTQDVYEQIIKLFKIDCKGFFMCVLKQKLKFHATILQYSMGKKEL